MSDFHGVYLLCSIEHNKTIKGTYIGYTVLPGRRILQHNRFQKGGAHKTAKYAPWDMILCVHNFPNRTAGLRFEWAWQNPKVSVRLKMYDWAKKKSETGVRYQVRILEKMLNVAPWYKLPLTVQWLRTEYKLPLAPPIHMPIALGPIEDTTESLIKIAQFEGPCGVCSAGVTRESGVYCVHSFCIFHLTCLADKWVVGRDLLPTSGSCPECGMDQSWGDMVKLKRISCRTEKGESSGETANHWTDILTQSY